MVTDEEVDQWVKSHYEAPEIKFDPDNWLWANDWYDGPLCGIMTYGPSDAPLFGWFDWIEEAPYKIKSVEGHWFRPRVYAIRELTLEQARHEAEQRYHYRRLYDKWGDLSLTDNHMQGILDYLKIIPREINTEEEYEQAYPERDYASETMFNYGYREHNKVVCWFVERYNPNGETRSLDDDD